jgi:hypothetical protein
MNTFNTDLETGKKIESDILDLIKLKYPQAFGIDGYCKAYDIFVPETSKGIEVKLDFMSSETGNIVVEVRMNGKLSALSTTLAHYWVFVTHYKYAFIKPERIKDCIVQNNLDMKTFTACGDTSSKDAYLIKEDMLFSYADKVISKTTTIKE